MISNAPPPGTGSVPCLPVPSGWTRSACAAICWAGYVFDASAAASSNFNRSLSFSSSAVIAATAPGKGARSWHVRQSRVYGGRFNPSMSLATRRLISTPSRLICAT